MQFFVSKAMLIILDCVRKIFNRAITELKAQ